MKQPFLFIRAFVFTLGISISTAIFGILILFMAIFPARWRYWFLVHGWCRFFVWLARYVCGIRYQVLGRENLLQERAILLAKHQSAWETVALPVLMAHRLCFVFKRELLRIPFFGWGIALMRMIHIDRSKGSQAFEDVVAQGEQRLAEGAWITMFPEGTRTAVGQQGRYKTGGARLAVRTQTPVVPIALNSGERWPRGAFIKSPGLITISIGPAIGVHDKTVDEVNQAVADWIETEMRRISPQVYQE